MQKKILFILTEQQFYRNYITSGALQHILDQCVFLVHPNLMSNDFPGINRDDIIPYSYPGKMTNNHQHIFNINMRAYRDKSKTFVFRFSRLRRRWRLIYKILGLPVISQIVKFVLFQFTHDEKLAEVIERIKPDLILVPSTGYEGISFELIYQAKKHDIKSCLLIDNWDNLSSKTIFTLEPDYLTVWGEQTAEHAEKIHDINREKVFVLGTPRFREYLTLEPSKLPSPYPFKYAVFAGNALPFDELTTLKKLDEEIEKNGTDITIIYRPHPWRQPRKCADTFFEYDFKHIKLDVQARLYYKREMREKFAPELDYYPKLLHNMKYMICPLSTMLIEGLLFDKKIYVLTYDDGVHTASPKYAFENYVHFEGIENLPNIVIINEFEKLSEIFSAPESRIDGEKTARLNWYISEKTKDYPIHLKEIVDEIFSNS